MALAKERGAYPIFRIHPIVYEFYLYIILFFIGSLYNEIAHLKN